MQHFTCNARRTGGPAQLGILRMESLRLAAEDQLMAGNPPWHFSRKTRMKHMRMCQPQISCSMLQFTKIIIIYYPFKDLSP